MLLQSISTYVCHSEFHQLLDVMASAVQVVDNDFGSTKDRHSQPEHGQSP